MVTDAGDPEIIWAPFTALEVDTMNRWQHEASAQAFSCRRPHPQKQVLIAGTDGWACPCPSCFYTQSWAHAVQGDPAALEKYLYAKRIVLAIYTEEN